MNIRHLKIFIEVADTGKMSTAAENLFISQPTVSQTIKELEDHYGVLLFERLCKKLYITSDGKKLLSYAKYVVKSFDDLENKMFQVKNTNKINIGATITIGNIILPTIISNLSEKTSAIKTYVHVDKASVIQKKLMSSELDIGLIEGRIRNPNLISIPAITDKLVLVCSGNHPLASKKSITLKDLENEKFVMREKGSMARESFENYLYDNNVNIDVVFEVNCPGSIKNVIIQNDYLSFVSLKLIENEVETGLIHVLDLPGYSYERTYNIVYHKNKFLDESLELLISAIKPYANLSLNKIVKNKNS